MSQHQISPPETEPDAADAQPPEASLLGLSKELLNYVFELALVKDPDEGPTEANVDKRMTARRNFYRCPTPCPALGSLCRVLEEIVLRIYYRRNTFASRPPSHASRWFSQKRRKRDTILDRRIAFLFDAKGMKSLISHRKDGEDLEVEPIESEGTGGLSLAGECSFCAQTCQQCQRISLKKIKDINGRTLSTILAW